MHTHTKTNFTKWITTPCSCCGGNRKIINGRWLKEIRLEVGLDQRKFGALINVTSPYISDIERNRRDCPSDILELYLSFKVTNNND